MISRFTPSAERALNRALAEARELGHTYVGTEHLLLGLLSEKDSVAALVLKRRKIGFDAVKDMILRLEGRGTAADVTSSDLSPRARRVLEGAGRAPLGAFGKIGTEQILSVMLKESESMALKLLTMQNVTAAELLADLSEMDGRSLIAEEIVSPAKPTKLPPTLQKYGRDLTAEAATGAQDPVIGREDETERVIRTLCRRTKNNPCLIGEPGVGKTAVVEGLALRIAAGEVPEALRSKRLITLDLPSMIAGAKYRGEFEDRMKSVLSEVAEDPNLILFIDELHTIVGAGSAEGSVDAANIIKPALARGKLRMIGATTVSEYRKYIEKDAALERRFQPITIEEPTEAETLSILEGLCSHYEAHHGLTIQREALEAAVRLSVRYLPERRLPDKALDLLDEAASGKRMEVERRSSDETSLNGILRGLSEQKEAALSEDRREDAATLAALEQDYYLKRERLAAKSPSPCLTEEDIAKVLSLPEGSLSSPKGAEPQKTLRSRIFGQEEAIHTVDRIVRRGMMGLKEGDRPVAGMLFLGPSGVGKTEMAKALAIAIFGSERALLRLDMSEYAEKQNLSKLIGSPPGYVGYGEEGILTGTLHRRPRSLILFDEAEKAHPEVMGLLLQILDHGFLTDAMGRRIDCRSAIIVLTANTDTDTPSGHGVGFTPSESDATNNEAIARRLFRPELLGRLDAVIPFRPLTETAAEEIVKALLSRLQNRLQENRIPCEVSPSVIPYLAKKGLSSRYGARPLKRLVEEEVEDALLLHLGEHPLKEGQSLLCQEENGKISVKTVTKRPISHMM